MTTSDLDAYRPPEPEGGRRRRRDRPPGERTGGGRGEQPMVPDMEFSSYYGQPIVKPMPWTWEIPAYLFLGGVAAGSGMLAAGAHAGGLDVLRRNARLTSMAAVALSGTALVADLGKPSRFYNMLRTAKLTSPMSVGTWILSGFSAFSGLTLVFELDEMTARRITSAVRGSAVGSRLAETAESAASTGAFFFGPPLAAYTAVLLSDTAHPTWHEAYRELPFVFVGSAAMASGGVLMALTATEQAWPARRFAIAGAATDLAAMALLERRLADVGVDEPLHQGGAGRKLRLAKALTIAGGIGTVLLGRTRIGAVASGLALAAGSALTRFGIVEAGLESAKDPKYTVTVQKRRLAERRARGITHDSATTAG